MLLDDADSVDAGRLLLGFGVESAGNVPEGGFVTGREGCGSVDVEAMLMRWGEAVSPQIS